MKVKDFMTRDPASCGPQTPLRDIAKLMVDHDCGEIPIVDEAGKPIGVVTDRDIVCRIIAEGKDPSSCKASDCMSSPCLTISSGADLAECRKMMEQHQLRRLLVVEQDGRMCGIVAQADLAREASTKDTANVVKKVSERRAA